MQYLFETTATMKPHNNNKWWIDSGIIRKITVDAENVEQALKQYQQAVQERDYIEISNNALKNKNPMYRDTANGDAQQVGFVITAKTDFHDDQKCKWTAQYIDLWVTVNIIANPFDEGEQ